MAWSLLIRGGTRHRRQRRAARAGRRRRRGRSDRRHRPPAGGDAAARTIDAHGPRGGAGVHRRPLALRSLLLRLPVGGVEDPPGVHHRGGGDVLVLAGARSPPDGRRWCRTGRAGSAPSIDFQWETLRPVPRRAPRRAGRRSTSRSSWATAPCAWPPSAPRTGTVTSDDMRAMERLLAEALDAGAYGYSTGLVYPPSAYSGTAGADRRSPGRWPGAAVSTSPTCAARAPWSRTPSAEAIRIGEDGDVGVQIAHVKVGGRENWGKMDRVPARSSTRLARAAST